MVHPKSKALATAESPQVEPGLSTHALRQEGRPVNGDDAEILTDWHRSWKTELIARSLRLRPGVFIDVGANRGQTLMDYFASGQSCSYIGFEPNSHCVSLISDVIAMRRRTDCVVVPIGLSDENTIRKLLLEKGSRLDSSASIDAGLRPDREWDLQFVPCFRLDDIHSSIGIGKIGLIKIDVEGSELSVLRGMEVLLRRDRPWILCEVLHRDSKVSPEAHQQRMDSLTMWTGGMDYVVFNVKKSPDEQHVREMLPLHEFSNKMWTWDNGAECDYMFVPSTDAGLIGQLNVR